MMVCLLSSLWLVLFLCDALLGVATDLDIEESCLNFLVTIMGFVTLGWVMGVLAAYEGGW